MIYVNVRAIVIRGTYPDIEVLIQRRNKVNEPDYYELPGGRIEKYESIFKALRREVAEETGLEIINIMSSDRQVFANKSVVVESLNPYAVYQTIDGYIDSFGVHFICNAQGTLLKDGDGSKNIKWLHIDEIAEIIKQSDNFSPYDALSVIKFINEIRLNEHLRTEIHKLYNETL